MRRAIDETNHRRAVQAEYNHAHEHHSQTIQKAMPTALGPRIAAPREAARQLEFERAAKLRDRILTLLRLGAGVSRLIRRTRSARVPYGPPTLL
jgi:excinuclease UvrABC helicase subunit UvrB